MSKKISTPATNDVYQAIVLIDSYSDEFAPITNEMPFSLIPLCNFPIIEYTLQSLELGGIQNVYIVGGKNFDSVANFINQRHQEKAFWSSSFSVHLIKTEKCSSLGDCLRELDARNLIRGDFILVEAGLVSLAKLSSYIDDHRKICKKDKGATMSLLFHRVGVNKHCKDDITIVRDGKNKLLRYRYEHGGLIDVGKEFNRSIYNFGLRDCRVCICSASVLNLFTDNFDFQTRDDFVKDMLTSDDLSNETVYCHILKDVEYSATINNWRMYQRLSKDIMRHFLQPMIPGSVKPLNIDEQYIYNKGSYRNKKSQLHRTTAVDRGVMIGINTTVGSDTSLCNTILGDDVTIGNDVKMEEAYVFDNSQVGDACTITNSIISYNCTIEEGCTITRSTIIGKNIRLPPNTVLTEELVVSAESKNYTTCNKLGVNAFIVKLADDDNYDDDTDEEIEQNLSAKMTRLFDADELNQPDNLDDCKKSTQEAKENRNDSPADEATMFLSEIIESLTRGYNDDSESGNLILEINSSRYAYNINIYEVAFNVTKAIMSLPSRIPHEADTPLANFNTTKKVFDRFQDVIKNYVRDKETMIACLQALEDETETNSDVLNWFVRLMDWLYESDFLSEEAILAWYKTLDEDTLLSKKLERFIQWLEQEDEDSEDD